MLAVVLLLLITRKRLEQVRPVITLVLQVLCDITNDHFSGSYNKDDALTTISASGPLGSAGTISAGMTSTGSSQLTASFKF